MKKKALLVRLDRMGDLICSLPADQHPGLKDYDVEWCIYQEHQGLVQLAVPKRSVKYLDKKKNQHQEFRKIISEVKPDLVVIFFAPAWAYWEIFRARIKIRAGRLSQLSSYLFLNKGARQSRSKSQRHELNFNLDILNHVFKNKASETPILSLRSESDFSVVKHKLLAPQLAEQNYFVIHPGMGGSALNWDIKSYAKIISSLTPKSYVVVTGTHIDEKILTALKKEIRDTKNLFWSQSLLNLNELACLLQNAKAVLAPSTGVAHLAAATGVPTLSIYPPLLAHSATRWAPLGKQVKVLSPKVKCPATRVCLESACQYFPCMSQVTTQAVLEGLNA